ncbi:CBS domain-containing protein CBSCBSPB5 [Zea mays]|uniref:CBS domain-containing protein CBSCBSPB5 n=1 Tax=Zea mays TaxID=4577 RepID=A0A3L6F0W4_MAIZE|nr:CBS domain-containing protein CBSCBSPB5 [Zea mays]
MASEAADIGRSALFPASGLSNPFGFKIEEKQGRMHRFNCETSSLTDLITSILQRVGDDIDRKHMPQILYEDEDHDKVILLSDSDLIAAVDHARQIGWKSLRLHLDYAHRKRGDGSSDFEYAGKDAWASAYFGVIKQLTFALELFGEMLGRKRPARMKSWNIVRRGAAAAATDVSLALYSTLAQIVSLITRLS